MVMDREEESVQSIESVYCNSANYTNVVLGDIAVDDLPMVIKQKSENCNEEFEEEYKVRSLYVLLSFACNTDMV